MVSDSPRLNHKKMVKVRLEKYSAVLRRARAFLESGKADFNRGDSEEVLEFAEKALEAME